VSIDLFRALRKTTSTRLIPRSGERGIGGSRSRPRGGYSVELTPSKGVEGMINTEETSDLSFSESPSGGANVSAEMQRGGI